jgi:Holliday junction resolvase
MNQSMQHESAVHSTASELEKKGYSVIIEPDPSIIPFELNQYCPDILATRGNENLIIEIKTRGSYRSIERYKEIAEIVGNHENWRFMLSTIDESESIQVQADPKSLNRMLTKLDILLSGENYDLALPSLWSVYISAMRIVGERAGVPVDVTSDHSFLNYMYSLGEISSDEYELAQQFLKLRNKAAHSLEVNISRETMFEMYRHTKDMVLEWGLIIQ